MNKFIPICFALAVACANAAYAPPAGQIQKNANNDIPILRFENTNNGEQGYNWAYESGDGTQAQESGFLKDADSPSAQGGFSFTSPEGINFQIQYTADENGFLPQGNHIPTPPPIPEEILKGLQQNEADEAKGIFDDGLYKAEASPHQQFQRKY